MLYDLFWRGVRCRGDRALLRSDSLVWTLVLFVLDRRDWYLHGRGGVVRLTLKSRILRWIIQREQNGIETSRADALVYWQHQTHGGEPVTNAQVNKVLLFLEGFDVIEGIDL